MPAHASLIWRSFPTRNQSGGNLMKTARLLVILCCLLTVFMVALLKHSDALETQCFQVEQTRFAGDNNLRASGTFVLQCAWGAFLLAAAIVWSWMENRRADLHIARFGGRTFLIHRKNLQSFYPAAIALAWFEIRKSIRTTHDEKTRQLEESEEEEGFYEALFQDSADEFSSSTPNSVV